MDTDLARFVKDFDPVSYWSVLFAPPDRRDALLSLHAFAVEIKRIPTLVSEPALGEIRMQWWIDGLKGERGGELQSHPQGQALLETCARFNLPRAPLSALIEARASRLSQDDPLRHPDEAALELYCGQTHASLLQLTSLILNDGHDPKTSEASGHAGMVLGLIELVREGATELSHQDLADLAQEHLIKTRHALQIVPDKIKPAFLLLAIAEPFLKSIARGQSPERALPAPWRVLLRMTLGRL
jgi:phytoene synthase